MLPHVGACRRLCSLINYATAVASEAVAAAVKHVTACPETLLDITFHWFRSANSIDEDNYWGNYWGLLRGQEELRNDPKCHKYPHAPTCVTCADMRRHAPTWVFKTHPRQTCPTGEGRLVPPSDDRGTRRSAAGRVSTDRRTSVLCT